MSYKQQIEAQLSAIAAAGAAGVSPTHVAADTPQGRLECEVFSADAIGCSLASVALQTSALVDCTVEELKAVSEKLAQKVNYLLEPISPIEIDSEGATVQMRSNPPHQDDDGTKYYELLVRRDGLLLSRYSRAKGGQRQPVAAHLTREVLLRVCGDFVAAIA
jgi:hypothetical protein